MILTSPSNNNGANATAMACPICNTNAADAFSPFCSKRCADVDLHRWLNGTYAIPAVEDDSEGVDGEQSFDQQLDQ